MKRHLWPIHRPFWWNIIGTSSRTNSTSRWLQIGPNAATNHRSICSHAKLARRNASTLGICSRTNPNSPGKRPLGNRHLSRTRVSILAEGLVQCSTAYHRGKYTIHETLPFCEARTTMPFSDQGATVCKHGCSTNVLEELHRRPAKGGDELNVRGSAGPAQNCPLLHLTFDFNE